MPIPRHEIASPVFFPQLVIAFNRKDWVFCLFILCAVNLLNTLDLPNGSVFYHLRFSNNTLLSSVSNNNFIFLLIGTYFVLVSLHWIHFLEECWRILLVAITPLFVPGFNGKGSVFNLNRIC